MEPVDLVVQWFLASNDRHQRPTGRRDDVYLDFWIGEKEGGGSKKE